ncbi:MAG: hypothetical protein NTZ83_05350 [Candidatus Pacearchaeota archaeon]|nr:hypothetical protein [Candidatus Pacearchaeota archaeon]
MADSLIDRLNKEIENMNLDFIQKVKTDKWICLLYKNHRVNLNELFSIVNKYNKDFKYSCSVGYLPFEKLSRAYGFNIEQISKDNKKWLDEFGTEVVMFKLKKKVQADSAR